MTLDIFRRFELREDRLRQYLPELDTHLVLSTSTMSIDFQGCI